MPDFPVHVQFPGRLVFVGFGGSARACCRCCCVTSTSRPSASPSSPRTSAGSAEAAEYGIKFAVSPLTRENYRSVLEPLIGSGDFLLNLSVDVSSIALIELCYEKGAMYLDTCIEPWRAATPTRPCRRRTARTTGCAKPRWRCARAQGGPTAVLTHGANPGLVSHWVKQAMLNIAADTGVEAGNPKHARAMGARSRELGVKVIHIAERDTQVANVPKRPASSSTPGRWTASSAKARSRASSAGARTRSTCRPTASGTSSAAKRDLPDAAGRRQARALLDAEGRAVPRLPDHARRGDLDLRTTHACAKASRSCTGRRCTTPITRATTPCSRCTSSPGATGTLQERKRILDGRDHRRHRRARRAARGAQEERVLVRLAALDPRSAQARAVQQRDQHPGRGRRAGRRGVGDGESARGHHRSGRHGFPAHARDRKPYLGQVVGAYSDWTPLHGREQLFPEDLDSSDPWQFKNVLV